MDGMKGYLGWSPVHPTKGQWYSWKTIATEGKHKGKSVPSKKTRNIDSEHYFFEAVLDTICAQGAKNIGEWVFKAMSYGWISMLRLKAANDDEKKLWDGALGAPDSASSDEKDRREKFKKAKKLFTDGLVGSEGLFVHGFIWVYLFMGLLVDGC